MNKETWETKRREFQNQFKPIRDELYEFSKISAPLSKQQKEVLKVLKSEEKEIKKQEADFLAEHSHLKFRLRNNSKKGTDEMRSKYNLCTRQWPQFTLLMDDKLLELKFDLFLRDAAKINSIILNDGRMRLGIAIRQLLMVFVYNYC